MLVAGDDWLDGKVCPKCEHRALRFNGEVCYRCAASEAKAAAGKHERNMLVRGVRKMLGIRR